MCETVRSSSQKEPKRSGKHGRARRLGGCPRLIRAVVVVSQLIFVGENSQVLKKRERKDEVESLRGERKINPESLDDRGQSVELDERGRQATGGVSPP